MAVRENWASRKHMGPGDSGAVRMQKAIGMGMVPPKPEKKVRLNQGAGWDEPGKVFSPGWFATPGKSRKD